MQIFVGEKLKKISSKESHIEACSKELESKEEKVEERVHELQLKERHFEARFRELKIREEKFEERVNELKSKEANLNLMKKDLETREKELDYAKRLNEECSRELDMREEKLLLQIGKSEVPGRDQNLNMHKEVHSVMEDQNFQVQKREVHNGTLSGFKSHLSGPNQQQATKSYSQVGQGIIWTCCPSCNIKYQYYKAFVNQPLSCLNCLQTFDACALDAENVAPRLSSRQHVFSEPKEVPYQEHFVPITSQFPASDLVEESDTSRIAAEELKANEKDEINADVTYHGKTLIGRPQVDVANDICFEDVKDTSKRRSLDPLDTIVEHSGKNQVAGQDSENGASHCLRRRFRRRQYISSSDGHCFESASSSTKSDSDSDYCESTGHSSEESPRSRTGGEQL